MAEAVSWTPPTSTEIGVVVKSALAAGLAWLAATALTNVSHPVLAPLTAIVIVQVSVRSSVMSAIQRSAAVVLGVLLAVGIGDALGLQRVHDRRARRRVARLRPARAAPPRPGGAAGADQRPRRARRRRLGAGGSARDRILDTVVGAAVGVLVSFVLPASRLVDARQTLDRLAASIAGVLESMGQGLQSEWTVEQTEEWRRRARTIRDRSLRQAVEAVGNSRESSRWNVRDRRHVDVLSRYEEMLPRLERTAIGVSVISRGIDDHAHLRGTSHRPMRSMGELLESLAAAVQALVAEVLDPSTSGLATVLVAVGDVRARCIASATRQAREAMEHPDDSPDLVEDEWLSYAAILVQVDRIVADLSAPLPTD